MQSNGITAICDLGVGVCNCGDLIGDSRSNTIKGLQSTAHLSQPSLQLDCQVMDAFVTTALLKFEKLSMRGTHLNSS